jgi:hypothetical protein
MSANMSIMARTTLRSNSIGSMNTTKSSAYNETLCQMVSALSEDSTPAESARQKRGLRASMEIMNSIGEMGSPYLRPLA